MDTGFVNKTILPLGYLCVIYLAAMIGIDHEYYEAATIDRAGKWQQIKSIKLPLITPVVTVMTLLRNAMMFLNLLYSDKQSICSLGGSKESTT